MTNLFAPNGLPWSSQQNAILDWFANGTGNLVVRARAGTGKTSVIAEGVERSPEASVLVTSFGKYTVGELNRRLRRSRNAEAITLNGVGHRIVLDRRKDTKLDCFCVPRVNHGKVIAATVLFEDAKAQTLARPDDPTASDDAPDDVVTLVDELAEKGKESAVGVFLNWLQPDGDKRRAVDSMIALAYKHGCTPDRELVDEGWSVERIAVLAFRAMALARRRDGTINWADQVFLPIVNDWSPRRPYDMIVVDEAQDMNEAQLLLALRVTRGRVCIVGDDRQAIYGFRGADSQSIDRLKFELGAIELPLSVSFRCDKRIIAVTQRLVGDITASPSAGAGSVTTISAAAIFAAAQPGDFILSRKNAPLAGICLGLLRSGKRATIKGKDVGRGLIALLKRFGKTRSVDDLMKRIWRWCKSEIEKIEKEDQGAIGKEDAIDQIRDKAELLVNLCDGIASVAELVKRIETLFTEDSGPAMIVCSTVHKAKGLEADRVFLLSWTFREDGPEEINILYVAQTRARHELVFVEASDAKCR